MPESKDTAHKAEKPICGIIMPISKCDEEHSPTHWEKVKDILSEAINEAGCKPQPVWEGSSHDIIQAKILQNIYDNPVVVCDLSTRNPNVMLEIGMRLTTKKPTLLVAEEGTTLPFDTAIIHTEFYNPRLEYRTTQRFIQTLKNQISEKLDAYEKGEYRPYLEAFEFETVQPSRITVSSDERLNELIEKMETFLTHNSVMVHSKRAQASDLWENLAAYRAPIGLAAFRAPIGDVKQADSPIDDDNLNSMIKSRFDYEGEINELSFDGRNTDIDVSDWVSHPKFGVGIVIEKEGGKLFVDFDKFGKRKILAAFLKRIT